MIRTFASVVVLSLSTMGMWTRLTENDAVAAGLRLAETQRSLLMLTDTVHALRAKVLHQVAMVDSAPEMIVPVSGSITSPFAKSRLHPLLGIFRPHHGVDLSAPTGTKIIAPALATVSFVGWRMGDGLTVELTHAGGITTRFAHCHSTLVRVGQHVMTGDAIATVGATGLATGAHLHFEVMVRGLPVDPMKYLALAHDSTTAVAEHLRAQGQ
jgi:murein DD-endopeptidase MepM/ murein hydrolase activator NlpD